MGNKTFFSLFNKERFIFLGLIFIFLLLVFKDPFSQRTLIPNFEPYPDTFHYINPALNFVKGEGFNMNREGREITLKVPPLYSFVLVPVFFINPDPRMAYYANVLLALISLFLFRAILKKILANKILIYFLLVLYITNYYIYWVPTIIMGENLTLTLYLTSLFVLLSKISKVNLIITSISAVGLYATKYSSIPITSAIILLSLIKINFGKFNLKQKMKLILFFLISLSLLYLALGIFEEASKGRNIIGQYFEHLSSIYSSIPKGDAVESEISSKPEWFGIQYVSQNLPLYLKSLIGNSNRFLWDQTPLVPQFVGIFGLIGILAGLFYVKVTFISFSLLIFIATSIIFISTFYSFDARYIYIVIPTLVIGFGLFLQSVENKINMDKKMIFNILVIIFTSFYLTTNLTRIKSQISLNLRYAETPWNYIAVLKMNEYFTKDKIINEKKPILISALPPFLIDYYKNGNYTLLPLSYEQEFRGQETRQIVWGPNDYSDLQKLYKQYLNEGYNVYVSRAGLGNEGYTNRDFNTIVEKFDTKLVLPGCYDQCNIYKVELKNDEL